MKTRTLVLGLSLILIGLLSTSLSAQRGYHHEAISPHAFKINFLLPGLEYEVKLMQDFTFCFRGGLNIGLQVPGIFGENATRLKGKPYGEVQIRRFFKTKSKSNKGKTLIGSSGDYFGLRLKYFYNETLAISPEFDRYVSLVGPMYGLQRNFNNKLSWSFHTGLGTYLGGVRLSPTAFIGITIGYLAYH